MSLDQSETISRLCNLVSEVGKKVFADTLPHDCFCNNFSDNCTYIINPTISNEIVEFIEKAVHECINDRQKTREIANIMDVHTTDSVKDVAMEVCIASGEGDIFIDMETVGDRMPRGKNPDIDYLRTIIERANEAGVDYVHLF